MLSSSGTAPSRLLRERVPLLASALHERCAIFRQYPTLPDELGGGARKLLKIGLATGIALGNRPAWVAGLLAFDPSLGEGEKRTLERHALRCPANRRITKIPSRVS